VCVQLHCTRPCVRVCHRSWVAATCEKFGDKFKECARALISSSRRREQVTQPHAPSAIIGMLTVGHAVFVDNANYVESAVTERGVSGEPIAEEPVHRILLLATRRKVDDVYIACNACFKHLVAV
jgi:hypothetical protein